MFLYRFALFWLAPILALAFGLRRLRGRETGEGLWQRAGIAPRKRPTGPVIWLHGASIGELTAARALLVSLLDQHPGLGLVATMNSYSARDLVRGWGDGRITPVLAPLDYRFCMRRFLKAWRPVLLISLENEIWPNRLVLCEQATIPVVILGGRISARGGAFWARFSGLAASLFQKVAYLVPQDATSEQRFLRLGVDSARVGPLLNLKSTVALPVPERSQIAAWARAFPRDTTLLAASTHVGEDAVVLEAFVSARRQIPDLRLILAPRHPDRATAVSDLIAAHGLTLSRRSQSDTPKPKADVLLADTLGEMALWYALAGATLVGGTLVDKGGHTPFEPTQFGTAIIHGPFVANHQAAYSALDGAGGALRVDDAQGLAQAYLRLSRPAERQPVLDAAGVALSGMRDSTVAESVVLAKIAEILAKDSSLPRPGPEVRQQPLEN